MISDHGACMARIPTRAFEDPAARAEVDKRIREADSFIYSVMDQGQKDGTLSFIDRAVALHTLFGSLNWTAYWAKAAGRLRPTALAEAQVDVLLEGVRGPKVAVKPSKPEAAPKRGGMAKAAVAASESAPKRAPARVARLVEVAPKKKKAKASDAVAKPARSRLSA